MTKVPWHGDTRSHAAQPGLEPQQQKAIRCLMRALADEGDTEPLGTLGEAVVAGRDAAPAEMQETAPQTHI